jgi:hypothetical protein
VIFAKQSLEAKSVADKIDILHHAIFAWSNLDQKNVVTKTHLIQVVRFAAYSLVQNNVARLMINTQVATNVN